ncbi:rRNA adenine N-6-methyltransferase family protein [Candidatus Vidania fulgoroideorum]
MNIKGKNFLNKRACKLLNKKIVINKRNKILEIASGYGNLTNILKKKIVSKIIEFEIDNMNVISLNENVVNINYRIYGRILIFGNIPYNITTEIIKNIKRFCNIRYVYLMLQNEYLKKINFFFKKIISYKKICKKFFIPSPKVESNFIKVSNFI